MIFLVIDLILFFFFLPEWFFKYNTSLIVCNNLDHVNLFVLQVQMNFTSQVSWNKSCNSKNSIYF